MTGITTQTVTESLTNEMNNLSKRNWSKAGDVNMKEHGGLKYRKSADCVGMIDVVFFKGNGAKPVECSLWLSDLIAEMPAIWIYSDIENCGIDIGNLILSLESYCGMLSECA